METADGSLREEVATGVTMEAGGGMVDVEVTVGTGVLVRACVDVGTGTGVTAPHAAPRTIPRTTRVVIREKRNNVAFMIIFILSEVMHISVHIL